MNIIDLFGIYLVTFLSRSSFVMWKSSLATTALNKSPGVFFVSFWGGGEGEGDISYDDYVF